MKRAHVRIGRRDYGKTDIPSRRDLYDMWRAVPDDGAAFETEADRALSDRVRFGNTENIARLRIHVDGFDATFSEWRQFRYLIWVFGRPAMPRGYRLTGREELGTGGNRHWLSRLPAHMKRWAFRRRVVAFLLGPDPQVRRYVDWHLAQGATPPRNILDES